MASINKFTAQSQRNLNMLHKLRQKSLSRLLNSSINNTESKERIRNLNIHFKTQYIYTVAFNACSKPINKRSDYETKDLEALISMKFEGYSKKKIKRLGHMFFTYEPTPQQISNLHINNSK